MTQEDKKMAEDFISKKYFTTYDLMKASWFPINSHTTIRRMILCGRLKAKNISLNPKRYRWRIEKENVINFMVNLEDGSI